MDDGVKDDAQWARRFLYRYGVECVVFACWKLEDAGFRLVVSDATGHWYVEPVEGCSLTEEDMDKIFDVFQQIYKQAPPVRQLLPSGPNATARLEGVERAIVAQGCELYEQEKDPGLDE